MPVPAPRVIDISVSWAGASAEEVERGILLPIEPALREIEGVVALTSVARDGLGSLSISFDAGADMGEAERRVEAATAAVALPAGAGAPLIARALPAAEGGAS